MDDHQRNGEVWQMMTYKRGPVHGSHTSASAPSLVKEVTLPHQPDAGHTAPVVGVALP